MNRPTAIRNGSYACRSSGAASGGSAIGNRVVTVIAIMGAALIGLGIIAFIAANWSDIPKLVKLAMMVVGTPAIYVIGWFVGYRFGYRPHRHRGHPARRHRVWRVHPPRGADLSRSG